MIAWRLDTTAVEEDVFNLAVLQPLHRRSLSVEGCRILARQFRHRVEARQARAAALLGVSRACPLDLHTLLPVPAALLQLGPDYPQTLAWLRQNWGTTDKPRQVVERPKPSIGRRLPAGHSVVSYGFFTQGDSPVAAVRQAVEATLHAEVDTGWRKIPILEAHLDARAAAQDDSFVMFSGHHDTYY